MPLHIVRHRSRGVSYIVMLIVGAAMFAMFFFLSLFVQQVLGYSSIKAGVAFLPFTVGIGVSAQTGLLAGLAVRPALDQRRRRPAGRHAACSRSPG